MSDELIERLRGPVFGTQTALDAADAITEWKVMHGRVVEGFMEVCEAVGVQFDAPEAVAYAINVKISNAEYDKRAAEAALAEIRAENERLRKALEPFAKVYVPSNWSGDEVTLDEGLTAGHFRAASRSLGLLDGGS